MAAKVVLAALISLGLAIVGIATVRVVGAESSARAAALSVDCSWPSADTSQCEGAERREHLAWNAASWLVGLALVAAIGRRSKAAAENPPR